MEATRKRNAFIHRRVAASFWLTDFWEKVAQIRYRAYSPYAEQDLAGNKGGDTVYR